MFHKQPIRTYERKKPGAHSAVSMIIREDVPSDRAMQPKDFTDFQDTDETLVYDPFDTTFDRLLKTAVMPSKPPPEDSDTSWESSSSEEKSFHSEDDLPIPLGLAQVDSELTEPRRTQKRKKPDDPGLIVVTGRLKTLPKRQGKRNKSKDGNKNVSNENSEPNVEKPAMKKKRGRPPKADKITKEDPKSRQSFSHGRTPISAYRGQREGSLNNSKDLDRCSVNLTRLHVSTNKSVEAVSSNENDRSAETTQQVDDSTPGPSIAVTTTEDEIFTEQDISVEELIKKPITFVDATPIPKTTKYVELLKDSKVSLTRLKAPQRISIASNNWTSSTPITQRAVKKKSALRLSPIDKNESSKMRIRHGDENSGEASLPPKSPVSATTPVFVKSGLEKVSQQSNEKDEKNSANRPPSSLSDSPTNEPSCLMFEDSQVPEEKSYSVAAPEEHSPAAISSAVEEKRQDMTEASSMTPFKGFSIQSLDNVELSKENDQSAAPAVEGTSMINQENDKNTSQLSTTEEFKNLTKDSSDAESFQLTFDDDEDEDEDEGGSLEDVEHSVEDSHATSEKLEAPREQQPADKTDASMYELLAIPGTSRECVSNSDWLTLLDSTVAESDGEANDTSILSKMTSERSENHGPRSIEQLSSGDDNTSSDELTQIMEAVEAIVPTEVETARGGNEPNVAESCAVEQVHEEEDSRKDIRLNASKPVVLLERLQLPVRKSSSSSTRMTNAKNTREQTSSAGVNAIKSSELTVSNDNAAVPDKPDMISRRKSKRLTIETKSLSDSIESKQDATSTSAEDSVADIEELIPAKKSRKSPVVDESIVINPSDTTMESSQNSTLDSANDSVVSIETAEEKSLDAAELSENSTLSSTDDSVLSIGSPVPKRKLRSSYTMMNKSTTTSPSDAAEWTLSSADDSVSESEASLPVRKSGRLTQLNKIRVESLSHMLESSQDSTLSSNDDSISGIAAPVPAKKPRRGVTSVTEKRSEKNLPSDQHYPKPKLRKSNQAPNDDLSQSEKSWPVEEREKDSNQNTSLSSVEPVVLLSRLNDPVRVSLRRRKKYSSLNLGLSVIAENHGSKCPAIIIEEATEENNTSEKDEATETVSELPGKLSGVSQQTTASSATWNSFNTLNESQYGAKEDKHVFLKPGKSWARSLSILSNVHSQQDLDSMAVGKGKKWRESANSILQMQQQGLLQSCVKKNEDDKDARSFYGECNSTAATAAWIPESSHSDTSRAFGSASPGRFVRRVSIRVVPDGKNFDRIEDTPFLEAYGISTSVENRKTLAKRPSSIATTRKTLVYNVRDVNYDNIPKSINCAKSRDVVLEQCGQETSLPFEECYPASYLKHCRKIGEGVYGEVFLYEKAADKSVIKIIPIEGDMIVNTERQKKFDEILSEIVIAKELHNLRFADCSNTASFVEVKNIRCVVGKYPRKLLELWKTYDEEKNSENDCPAMFDANQLYIVLELGHGGQDLEAFEFQNASEAHALFMQAAVALAVAEEKLDFEHRDLHWGNILIARTNESYVESKLRDKVIRLVSKGVKVSVIDFTLSRMSYQGCSIFNDLSMDEDLFSAQGEYQFEIYRLMRKKLENDWRKFEPFTNVLWLHYMLDKMITAVRYRRKNSKIHNTSIQKLQQLKDTILNYESAVDFVTNCDKATRLQASRTSVA